MTDRSKHVMTVVAGTLLVTLVLGVLCLYSLGVGSRAAPPETEPSGDYSQASVAATPRSRRGDPRESYYLDVLGLGYENVFVRDEKNNFAGHAGGFGMNQISGLTLDGGVDQVSMVLSTTQHTYSVGFKAVAAPFTIKITRGVGNGDNANRQVVVFRDVVLPEGTIAKLIISPDGIGPNLLYDADGDRTFESSIAPTVNLSGPNAKDVTSPVVVITFAQQGSTANVTLTATDDLSGVALVRYSLDGKHFPFYSGPFAVDHSPKPITVTAFTDDNAGNRSGVYKKSFTFSSR